MNDQPASPSVISVLASAAALFVGTLAGGAAGGWVGSVGWIEFCLYVDRVRDVPGGDGLMTVGWLYWLVTIPLGIGLGLAGGFGLTYLLLRLRERLAGRRPKVAPQGMTTR